jgi:hypothetical protein
MVIEADACKTPMFMVLKIPHHPRHYRNMAASLNDSKLHVLKHASFLHQTSLHTSKGTQRGCLRPCVLNTTCVCGILMCLKVFNCNINPRL